MLCKDPINQLNQYFSILLLIFFTVISSSNLYAQENSNLLPTIIKHNDNDAIMDSKFGNWRLFEKNIAEDENICYLVNNPVLSNSDYDKRNQPFLMITRSSKTRREEVFLNAGFDLKNKSIVYLSIDNENYIFIAKDDLAITENIENNVRIVKKMLNSKRLIARYDAAIGKFAIDKYSLVELNYAYKRMREVCN
jgi:hypothetical protein